jgi:hypothetical protein
MNMSGQPYAAEEVLTFDRMRRAVTRRVMDAVDRGLKEGALLSRDRLRELTDQEWQRAKQAVWSSYDPSGKRLEYIRTQVSQLLREMMESDRAELTSMGVQDTPI